MSKSRFDAYPLPDWLQWQMEQNIGKPARWGFPQIAESPNGVVFEKLCFHNRHELLKMFEMDNDPWVDERFKDPKRLYEYVANLKICMLYSFKHGGCDWFAKKDGEYAGILHAFQFSQEKFGYAHRKCAIGYAFAKKFRGSGLPFHTVKYFQDFLFTKMDRLFLTASVDRKNLRSIHFLKKLGHAEYHCEYEGEAPRKEPPKELYFELFRSARAKSNVVKYRKKAEKEYREWKSKWVKNEDGSWTVPAVGYMGT